MGKTLKKEGVYTCCENFFDLDKAFFGVSAKAN
jgi:hypothetical protein